MSPKAEVRPLLAGESPFGAGIRLVVESLHSSRIQEFDALKFQGHSALL